MTESISVKNITNAFENADTLSSIASHVQNKIDTSNFKVIGYHCLPPIGADYSDPISLVSCLGVPSEETEDYKKKKLYRNNPFVMKPLLLARPLLWADIFKLPDLTRHNHCFIEVVEDRFKGNGISVPVFGPLGHNGNVSIRFGIDNRSPSSHDILELQMACQQAHINICDLLQKKTIKAINLTDREREVLEWVVLGKSNSVIADIMGISTHTVNGYMRRLFLKLNTSDRVSAAVRAIAIGAIY